MKTLTKEKISSGVKAAHKQKKLTRLAVNKKEQDILGNLGIFRPLVELIIEVVKKMRRK